MTELSDDIFKNNGDLPRNEILKYRIKGVEDISKDLVEFSAWDGSMPVSSVALNLENGIIQQCIFHMEGQTDAKRIDAKTVLGSDYRGGPGHQVRIGKLELNKFVFQGSLVSNWLGPNDFEYTVQRPSSGAKGVWREVDRTKVEEDGGLPLWIRAVAQPWPGLKVKVTFGLFTAKDVHKVTDSSHSGFPFVNLVTITIPILPGLPENHNIRLPFTPYLIDASEETEEEDVVLPNWLGILSACNGMFRDTTAPHSKSNMTNLNEALKSDWKKEKTSKYVFPQLLETEEETIDIIGEEEYNT